MALDQSAEAGLRLGETQVVVHDDARHSGMIGQQALERVGTPQHRRDPPAGSSGADGRPTVAQSGQIVGQGLAIGVDRVQAGRHPLVFAHQFPQTLL